MTAYSGPSASPSKRTHLQSDGLHELPGDLDPAHIRVIELVERGGAEVEVEVAVRTTWAGVHDCDNHGVGGFRRLPYFDFVAAERVVVGVAVVVEAHCALGQGGDEIAVGVLDTAGAETDAWGVEGRIAGEDGSGLGGGGGEEREKGAGKKCLAKHG